MLNRAKKNIFKIQIKLLEINYNVWGIRTLYGIKIRLDSVEEKISKFEGKKIKTKGKQKEKDTKKNSMNDLQSSNLH